MTNKTNVHHVVTNNNEFLANRRWMLEAERLLAEVGLIEDPIAFDRELEWVRERLGVLSEDLNVREWSIVPSRKKVGWVDIYGSRCSAIKGFCGVVYRTLKGETVGKCEKPFYQAHFDVTVVPYAAVENIRVQFTVMQESDDDVE
ncbi:hypothetical protein GR7B_00239 [Vibrio phage vB_VcorM_GR7B]|nr:hypothetical protein GR7B_00239 [Vibrio phage vB_VcorM_GR7B]